MGLDLVFNKIVDGERIERIQIFSINFIRDSYPQLINTILSYSSMRNSNNNNNSTSDVYICPSTSFMNIYNVFEEFYNENYSDKNTLKLELIDAINNDIDIDELTNLFDKYTNTKDGIFESYLVRIKEIMDVLKKYSNKNVYLYLSY